MYSPKYTITNDILKNVATVDACKEVIENAPIIPAYEKKFREEALIRTVHHGTHIEGNDLSLEQAVAYVKALHGNKIDAERAIAQIKALPFQQAPGQFDRTKIDECQVLLQKSGS